VDLDDLLAAVVDAASDRLSGWRRAQLLARVLFGAIGGALGLLGAYMFLTQPQLGGTPLMRLAMASVFVCLACASVMNLMLARRSRWPLAGLGLSVIGLLVARLSAG
jgi:hypothetical protein